VDHHVEVPARQAESLVTEEPDDFIVWRANFAASANGMPAPSVPSGRRSIQ
jgi:hypothetical protein